MISKLFWYTKHFGLKTLFLKIRPHIFIFLKRFNPYESRKNLKMQRQYKFSKNTKFSIVVPVFNTKKSHLKKMISSVLDQTYENFELILCDGSDKNHGYVSEYCKKKLKKDNRIKYIKLLKNKGISGNTNPGLKAATGDYIGLLDHDDILFPNALFENMKILDKKNVDVIYSDELLFKWNKNIITSYHLKPDYSPDTLRSHNYICHFLVFNKSLLKEAGYLNSKFDGAQDYDLILRLSEKTDKIYHVQKNLYGWRVHKESTASNATSKPYTAVAGESAIEAHLKRVGYDGTVTHLAHNTYRINYGLDDNPMVSVIIPNTNYFSELKICIQSIYEKTSYGNFEIIIIENNSTEKEVFEYYEKIKKQHNNLKIVKWNGTFNVSALNNFGVNYACGEHFIFLSNELEIISRNWIQEMLMYSQRKDVAFVGAKLYLPNNTIQHSGIVLGLGGVYGCIYRHSPRENNGYMQRLSTVNNVSAVTIACMMVKKTIFEKLNGFDESLETRYNDVDICVRAMKYGFLNIFTPFAEAYHSESKNKSFDKENEQIYFRKKHKDILENGDKYYNKNFSLKSDQFIIDFSRNNYNEFEKHI